MVTTKTNTHADPPLGSRWAQMWAYMWAEQLVIFWYMLPKVTFIRYWYGNEGYEASVQMLLNIMKHTSVCILWLELWSHDNVKHLLS